jgi:hypothetical protein
VSPEDAMGPSIRPAGALEPSSAVWHGLHAL